MHNRLPIKRISEKEGESNPKRHVDNVSHIPRGMISPFRFSHFNMDKLIGMGTYGRTYLATDTLIEKQFVVKIVWKTAMALKEIEIGMMMNSPYVCKTFGFLENDSKYYIIMEYVGSTDLFTFISKNPRIFMENPSFFWYMATLILRGMKYIHQMGYIHMDIKPENICLDFDEKGEINYVKIIDFGLSSRIENVGECFCGTINYLAPEIATGISSNTRSDIWSFGILCYVMLYASFPKQIASREQNPAYNQISIHTKLMKIHRTECLKPFFKKSSDQNISEIQDFIDSCLKVPFNIRPTTDELLKVTENNSSVVSQVLLKL